MTQYAPFFITLFILGCVVNVIFKWSHMRTCELHPIIIFLQRIGVLVSHEHHTVHHMTSNCRYCVIIPYLNIMLDAIYFWQGLEWMIYGITGIQPVP
jgi:hypothetical protein